MDTPTIRYNKQQHTCESCGGKFTIANKSHHIKTFKHQKTLTPNLTRAIHKKNIALEI
jgi:hypothetical protein